MKKSRILIVCIFVSMLVFPLAAINATTHSVDLRAPESQSIPSQESDFNRIGAIEGIMTQIDPNGGVRNAIGSFQNASFYGISYVNPYQAVAENQLENENGYVSLAQLEVAGRSVYPTGRVSGTVVMLTLVVTPIIVFAQNPASSYMVSPTLEDAQDLGGEMVTLFEGDLGIQFERLTSVRMTSWVYLYYNGTYIVDEPGDFYYIQYVSIPNTSGGNSAIAAMKSRLGHLGGFMDLLEGPNWPTHRSVFTETLMFDHVSDETGYYSGYMNPMYMINTVMRTPVRAHASHPEYVETVNTGVLGTVGFDVPNHISDGAGDETYSLKQHVGYTGDIESKMFQDSTANSISAVVAVTPSSLEVEGISQDWDHIGKDFFFNATGNMYLPTGQVISGNSTVEEIIQAMMVAYPQIYAYQLNYTILEGLNPFMFDSFIDSLWGGPGPFPDGREELLNMDWSMAFTGFPAEEINMDAARLIFNDMGINPDSLIEDLNETIFEEDPMRALVEAFIRKMDSYHLLDILVNTTYSNPYVLEGYINEYITNIETLLEDFAGISLPSSYATKEAFAALIEDHFGIVLQGLWDAMADFVGDTTGIKTAVHAMIDPIHLVEETVPYFWADVYSSLATEYDYGMFINFDVPIAGTPPDPYGPDLLWLTTENIVLTFDLDISSLAFSGPHLTITKSVPRNIAVGGTATVTLTVENIGDATAYDLKILDGISAGFDADKQYYWNRASLNAGDTWTVTTEITGEEAGTYAEIPAILCYFNVSLSSFTAGSWSMGTWSGAAMYTFSALGNDVRVGAGLPMETLIVIAVGGGLVIIVIVIIVIKKK
ncbi:MAG: hypothetical protein ACFFE2_10680 [Candidatus Thorarchaeota archaeon]